MAAVRPLSQLHRELFRLGAQKLSLNRELLKMSPRGNAYAKKLDIFDSVANEIDSICNEIHTHNKFFLKSLRNGD